MLRAKGAVVAYHDSHVPRLGRGRHYRIDLESVELSPARLQERSCLTPLSAIGSFSFPVLDARKVLTVPQPRPRFRHESPKSWPKAMS